MTNFDDFRKENIKEHIPNWPQIPDQSLGMLIVGGSGSEKKISHQILIKFLYMLKNHMKQNLHF